MQTILKPKGAKVKGHQSLCWLTAGRALTMCSRHIVWIDIGEEVLVMGPIISLCVRLSAVSLFELCEWSLGLGVL